MIIIFIVVLCPFLFHNEIMTNEKQMFRIKQISSLLNKNGERIYELKVKVNIDCLALVVSRIW